MDRWNEGREDSPEMRDDPGRHGRYITIEGWVYTRPCKTKNRDVLLLCTQKPLFLYLIHVTMACSSEKQRKQIPYFKGKMT